MFFRPQSQLQGLYVSEFRLPESLRFLSKISIAALVLLGRRSCSSSCKRKQQQQQQQWQQQVPWLSPPLAHTLRCRVEPVTNTTRPTPTVQQRRGGRGTGCQILRFNRLSTCVEAHWFRLHLICIRLHRIFCVMHSFRYVPAKFLVGYRPQLFIRLQ